MAETLRLRIFAGPNGSGKSTIIDAIRKERINGRPIDFGFYLNADEIGRELRTSFRYDLGRFPVRFDRRGFQKFAIESGLLGKRFTPSQFRSGHRFRGTLFLLKRIHLADQFAQLLTAFLCEGLIQARRKFSFETVFSHHSKLELIRRANSAGYKVYLYFIATESPEINIQRIAIRVEKGGHRVPNATVRKRYAGALGQLYPATQLAYQSFFFDNSDYRPLDEDPLVSLFANMQRTPSSEIRNRISNRPFPFWFTLEVVLVAPAGKHWT